MKTKPNILILHTDQLRHDWMGCAGHPTIRTPNIDALRASGRMFTRHWVANPVCQPSRGSLFTGTLPCTHGLWANGTSLPRRDPKAAVTDLFVTEGRDSLETQAPTLGDVFSQAGYRTAAMGKLHLQSHLCGPEGADRESMTAWSKGEMTADWTGPYYGFDHVQFCLGHHDKNFVAAGHYAAWLRERDRKLADEIAANPPDGPHQTYVSPIPNELHNTSFIADRFDSWLDEGEREGGEQPFMAFLGFPGPHHPFAPSFDILPEFEDWEDPGISDPENAFLKNSGYGLYVDEPTPPQIDFREEPEVLKTARRYTAAMVWQIDLAVGNILKSLESRGLRENTIIVFTGDHGDFLGNHHLLFKHMGACRDLSEVPFLLSGPGIEPGSVDRDVMSNMDVLPTLAAMAGVKETPPVTHGIDRSSPGSGKDHRAFGVSYNSLISGANHRLDNYLVADGRYRATFYPRHGSAGGFAELYDHEVDPWETTNLARDPAHAARLEQFRLEMMERLFTAEMPARDRTMYF